MMKEESENNRLNVVDNLSSFKFRLNGNVATIKSEKDFQSLDSNNTSTEFTLTIEHSQYTDVDSVGLQIWSGALLLSDYVIHEGDSIFSNKNVLELCSGTGFTSIIASMFCKTVTCTDRNEENILKTIQKNFKHNELLVKATFKISELDFFEDRSETIRDIVMETDIVLVSEVLYDNEITDGYIETLKTFFKFQSSAIIYMTVEKRFVFTLANLRVEAVHYDYFFRRLKEQQLTWKLIKLETDFPRYFFEYDRSKELELWRISLH